MTEKDYNKLVMRVKDKQSPYLKMLKLQMEIDDSVTVRRYTDLQKGNYTSKAHELWGDGTFVRSLCESPLGTNYDNFIDWYNSVAELIGKPLYAVVGKEHVQEPELEPVEITEPEIKTEPVPEQEVVKEQEPVLAPAHEQEKEPEPVQVPEEFKQSSTVNLAHLDPDVNSLLESVFNYCSSYSGVPVDIYEELVRLTGVTKPDLQAQYVQMYMRKNFLEHRGEKTSECDKALTSALHKLGLRIMDYENK